MRKRRRLSISIFFLWFMSVVVPLRSEVLVRWTEPEIPPPEILGVREVVIAWDSRAATVVSAAAKRGYRVYTVVSDKAAGAEAKASLLAGAYGVALMGKIGLGDQKSLEALGAGLRSESPQLPVVLFYEGGKRPQMLGNMIAKKDGFLQISSATEQPWIDSNVAFVRYQQMVHPSERAWLNYPWELKEPLEVQQGLRVEDYLLALADAGSLRANLVLQVHEQLQRGLNSGNTGAQETWKEIRRYMEFYSRENFADYELLTNVGVVAEDYEAVYEVMNLLGRHNVSFRALRPGDLDAQGLKNLDMLIAFNPLDAKGVQAVAGFATDGGIGLLVDHKRPYVWQSMTPTAKGDAWVAYQMGAGRVIELSAPVENPDVFARDVRRILGKNRSLIDLWNGITTVATLYREPKSRRVLVDLVNYAQYPLFVQARVKGSFSNVQYETPERGCCETLSPEQRNGFTEFVIPWLRMGGRVHLATGSQRER